MQSSKNPVLASVCSPFAFYTIGQKIIIIVLLYYAHICTAVKLVIAEAMREVILGIKHCGYDWWSAVST